jgi:D-sedoheptulose 7-phosphate isomerase
MKDIKSYLIKLKKNLNFSMMKGTLILSEKLFNTWKNKKRLFLCGNGGSAANAIHIANDFLYGVGLSNGLIFDVEALPSNSAVLTCLANDTGYKNIFSKQIAAKGNKDDLLIILSGSGNSENIIEAIRMAKKKKMQVFGIVGFDGGKVKKILQKNSLHYSVNDMQISEDLQLITLHICMQLLSKKTIN